jgi:hypothetical protein
MEPFFQMSSPQGVGVLAKDTLNTDYLSSNVALYPIRAMLRGHWLMLWTSVVYLLVSFVASLASEVIVVDTKTGCSGGAGANPCPPRLVTRAAIACLIEGLLAFTAVWIIFLSLLLHNRRSGICANPSNLATVASLLHHPQVLSDLRSIDPMASKQSFARSLGNKRYRLAYYETASGIQRYGVVVAGEQRDSSSNLSRKESTRSNNHHQQSCDGEPVQGTSVVRSKSQATPSTNQPRGRNSAKHFHNLRDALFSAILIGTLGLVIAYRKDSRDDPVNRFMNSQSFGPKFLMAAIGSLIDGNWKRIERGRSINSSILLSKSSS